MVMNILKYKICFSLMTGICNKQHLKPNSRKSLAKTEAELKKRVAYKKACMCQ